MSKKDKEVQYSLDTIYISYTSFDEFNTHKKLEIMDRIKNLRNKLKEIGFEWRVIKYNDFSNLYLNPLSEDIRLFINYDLVWFKEYYKELNRGDTLYLAKKDNIEIFLTNDKQKNLVSIQIDDDFKSIKYEEILKIIIRELFCDEFGKPNEYCRINCIVYDLYSHESFKLGYSRNKYKGIPDDIGVLENQVQKHKAYKSIGYNLGESILSTEYVIAQYSNTKSMIDLVKSHAISFFTVNEIDRPINHMINEDNPKLEELASTLRERTYNIFFNNLQDKSSRKNNLNLGKKT